MLNILDYVAVTEGEADGSVDTQQLETVVEPTVEQNSETTETEQIEELPLEYEIDGEKFSVDEIREWRKGNLRQSDYTKKTTELAKQRKEAEEALEVYSYLMSKPDLVKKLYEFDAENPQEVDKVQAKLDPVAKQINELNQKLLIKDIEAELKDITSKDKFVNDVELLQIANDMKCTVSVAYDIWKGKNMDKVLKEKEAEIKRQVAKQIKENADKTSTLISTADKTNEPSTLGLTDTQIAFADKLGMTPEDYLKYSKNPW